MEQATKAPGAADIIRLLDLRPHPEGGHFRETFRDETRVYADVPGPGPGSGPGRRRDGESARAASTAIYFLLARGERSHWHRVDAVEIWHHYAGAPLELAIAAGEDGAIMRLRLGNDVLAGERPQAMVPAHAWQAAASLGDWTLAGCTVAPGFEFDGFEMAPPGWRP
jgi:predicted cupin superfamily sugar epimerase